jgi:hypothetical protein
VPKSDIEELYLVRQGRGQGEAGSEGNQASNPSVQGGLMVAFEL